MYTRTSGCPLVSSAKRVLQQNHITYREVFIDRDEAARQRVLDWTGFQAVPTLVVSDEGSTLPLEPPTELAKGISPRGIDRGAMITEPNDQQLIDWLRKHHLTM
ncbi:MAG: glutaredoxin family protein [Anaerolineae bacterium]|nr:glutaredoxin family protein [Anaerolineae bacterium]